MTRTAGRLRGERIDLGRAHAHATDRVHAEPGLPHPSAAFPAMPSTACLEAAKGERPGKPTRSATEAFRIGRGEA